jgi:hypothetical protein
MRVLYVYLAEYLPDGIKSLQQFEEEALAFFNNINKIRKITIS